MKALLYYLFYHNIYITVTSEFKKASNEFKEAIKVWCTYNNYKINNSYAFKELIYSNINKIQELDGWIKYANFRTSVCEQQAIDELFKINNIEKNTILTYNDYKFIFDNKDKLTDIYNILNEFKHIYHKYEIATKNFLQINKRKLSFEEKQRVVNSKNIIILIHKSIIKAKEIELYFPKTYNAFSNNRDINIIPHTEIEIFISKIGLILGRKSFDSKSDKQDLFLLNYFSHNHDNIFNSIDNKVNIENQDSLKRAILDSNSYGNIFKFNDLLTNQSFYLLRKDFEEIGKDFESALLIINEYEDVVKQFNLNNGGKEMLYKQNFIDCVSPNKPLYSYLHPYIQEKTSRKQAKELKQRFQLGFSHYFGNIDINSCSISIIYDILNNHRKIVENKDIELKQIKLQRLEEKRKIQEQLRIQQEQLRIQQEIDSLRNCVNNWHLTRYGIRHNYIYEYLKTKAIRNASQSEWDIRHLIWALKNDPDKTDTQYSYSTALDIVIPQYEKILQKTFSSLTSKLTLACLPASTSLKNKLRWYDFSKRICNDLNMTNAYDHIRIVSDAVPKHLGGDGIAELSFDDYFFKGKYIVICDDIKTSGKSLSVFRTQLERLNATVICALTVGLTIHE